jgi:DNA invertase Pin-like site-specific DNA recombinase
MINQTRGGSSKMPLSGSSTWCCSGRSTGSAAKVLETLNHLQRLSAAGVGYRSFIEQYLDSCGIFKDAVLAILAVIAKQERVRLSERTIAGLEKARRQGRIGGRPSLVLDRKRIERMSDEGLTMREIAEEIGASAASICRLLKRYRRATAERVL